MLKKLKALVAKLEKTKQAQQLFRAARITGTALVAYALAHLAGGTGIAGTSITIGGLELVVETGFHGFITSL